MTATPSSREVDATIQSIGDWHRERLKVLRAAIKKADPQVVEEVKWRKPSRPAGVPVWSHDGILCIGEALKNAVRLSFPKGAQIKDPKHLFNARMDSGTVRAIDYGKDDAVDEAALKALIVQAIRLNNAPKAGQKR